MLEFAILSFGNVWNIAHRLIVARSAAELHGKRSQHGQMTISIGRATKTMMHSSGKPTRQ